MSPARSLLISEIGGRKSSIGVLLPRLDSLSGPSSHTAVGFLFGIPVDCSPAELSSNLR